VIARAPKALAGPECNTRMLLQDRPQLIVSFHDRFDPARGGTSDMALRGLLRQVPVWLVPGEDPAVGRWLSLDKFLRQRASRARRRCAGGPPAWARHRRSPTWMPGGRRGSGWCARGIRSLN